MDLSTLTPDQRACVEHVGGPLLVSAGAGSGKTFMLTQRIAYALLNPQESGVEDIDQVLAITFTELAASEIKARVRNKLREEGMAQQALKVDACWIGTIHGMCSRILHENALSLGLDPSFGLIDDTDRDQILADCINRALAEVHARETAPNAGPSGSDGRESPESANAGDGDAEGGSSPKDSDDGTAAGGDDGTASDTSATTGGDDDGATTTDDRYQDLFREYSADDVAQMLAEILGSAANVAGQLDALVYRDPLTPHDIATTMLDAMVEVEAAARTDVDKKGKQGSFASKAFDALFSPTGEPAFERLASCQPSYAQVAKALLATDAKFGTRVRKDEFANPFALFRKTYLDCCTECALGLAMPARNQLIQLARRALELFDRAKAALGAMDQNDLLLKTLDAFQNHPEVEARYRDRFRLVMVDEFQDTSGLQIAIISHLTGGDSRLCTVGDTQQSIYRFRGADVDTYREHKAHMRSLGSQGGLCRELGKNFRSHGDVIALVNRIFGAPDVFGKGGEFIELGWDQDHARKNPFPSVPRIDVLSLATPRSFGEKKGAKTYELYQIEAESIARRFVALHEAARTQGVRGCDWGDMVILLGRMTYADVYAQALRSHGIPCIITGGSGFDKSPEASEVCALLRAIANPLDDEAMLDALRGEAFGLSPDELLELSAPEPGGRRPYWYCLRDIDRLANSTEGTDPEDDPAENRLDGPRRAAPRVKLAASVLCYAVRTAGRRPADEVLTTAVLESGWLDRLQAQGVQGMAQAANVLKTIRLVRSIAQDGLTPRGVAGVAARLATKLDDGMKEKPGTLVAKDQNAVRILTIHASKGLEFPVVALADFYGLRAHTSPLSLETAGSSVYLSLRPSNSLRKGSDLEGLTSQKLTQTQVDRLIALGVMPDPAGPAPELDDAGSAGELEKAIRVHASAHELEEMRRKFYVGATRPREALVIAVHRRGKSNLDVADDLRRGLFGEGDFTTCPEGLDFGGTTRANVEMLNVTYGPDPSLDNPAQDGVRAGNGFAEGGYEGDTESPDANVVDGIDGVDDIDNVLLVNGVPVGSFFGADVFGADEGFAAGAEGAATSATVRVPEAPGNGEHIPQLEPQSRPCNPLRAGTFSYSSVSKAEASTAAMEGGDGAETTSGNAFSDPDEAPLDPIRARLALASLDELPMQDDQAVLALTGGRHANPAAFGSAMHQGCEWMVEDLLARRRTVGPKAHWRVPDSGRVAAFALNWQVGQSSLPELERCYALWAESSVARETLPYGLLEPEAPLFVTLQGTQGEPIHMEGAIDLLCYGPGDPADQTALVVDYKSGGSPLETTSQLLRKHALQAACYAYAILRQGFAAVEVRFVRLQQEVAGSGTDPDGGHRREPQTVRYRFERGQLQKLEEAVRTAYAKTAKR